MLLYWPNEIQEQNNLFHFYKVFCESFTVKLEMRNLRSIPADSYFTLNQHNQISP